VVNPSVRSIVGSEARNEAPGGRSGHIGTSDN
jgi:hypothetical protein